MRRLTHYLHVGWMRRGRRELRVAANRASIGGLDQKLSRPEDMNSIHEEPQLEKQMEFLCNVDEEYVPKVGMTFKTCTEANEFYKEGKDIRHSRGGADEPDVSGKLSGKDVRSYR
ncbi:hypothetical protein PIB30_076725 [Stylosanthes scabra]|uniref:Uncharacterized protein n=1 Tax=Stylosanthes scabra TaxID=79078 RepID=A0ABU6UPS9_9FABA|nr:hypothetical protein [Stylosanthes scabra]